MLSPDPNLLAQRQLARDRSDTARFRGIFERKVARMTVSPLGYLRGTATMFYGLLKTYPALGKGPPGEGWLCGDAHLENFGVYRTAPPARALKAGKRAPVVFDINDFDEAIVGPWRYDVLRLLTSLILGGRELGADGRGSIERSRLLLETYVDAAFREAHLPEVPHSVAQLIARVKERSHVDLLNRRTKPFKGSRVFVRGDRYAQLPKRLELVAIRAFETYARTIRLRDKLPRSFEVLDVAFRIAGTGSLGKLRVAVLTRGKGGRDTSWIFDMKEQSIPAPAVLLGKPALDPAHRVLAGIHACVPRPPRMTGTTKVDGLSMFTRRLAPQEDKLDLVRIAPAELGAIAAYLGSVLGRAHRRGAKKIPAKPWTREEQSALLDRAVAMAGIHEAAYLAMCKMTS
ncbi:MAG TPA: DUF2252 family protein [Polyangiaceae bacterium]|nr:DUF2252 family protein [Polyangiaceae bacterium]